MKKRYIVFYIIVLIFGFIISYLAGVIYSLKFDRDSVNEAIIGISNTFNEKQEYDVSESYNEDTNNDFIDINDLYEFVSGNDVNIANLALLLNYDIVDSNTDYLTVFEEINNYISEDYYDEIKDLVIEKIYYTEGLEEQYEGDKVDVVKEDYVIVKDADGNVISFMPISEYTEEFGTPSEEEIIKYNNDDVTTKHISTSLDSDDICIKIERDNIEYTVYLTININRRISDIVCLINEL